MKDTVIVIAGPTAVGKTKLSIEVAKKFNGEIISGDSMQVYKGMDIGTAKVTRDEMQGIPHHMLDIRKPNETFSVADFQQYVQEHIAEITAKGKVPIIVGGSGLYIQAALYNYNFSKQKRDEKITEKLEKELKNKGIDTLYKHLEDIDPKQAAKIHPNNHRRVIRALEIYESTGKTMSENLEKQQRRVSPYKIILIGLEMDRALLYNQINKRIDIMLEDGLETEVRKFYDQGFQDLQSMRAIGYKEFIPYFEGKETLEESVEILKRNSRRYAKRQNTWFKNQLDMNWFIVDPQHITQSFQNVFNHLAGILCKN